MFGTSHDLALLRNWAESCNVPTPEESRDDLAIRLFVYSLLFREVDGTRSFQGCSFTRRGPMVLLVVKSIEGEKHQVCYTTERSAERCIVAFCRSYLEGRTKWHLDKYRQD